MDHELTQRSVRERVPARVWRVRCEATSVFCFFSQTCLFDGRDLGPRNSYRWLLPEGLLCGPGPSNRVRDRGASDSYRRLLPEGLLCGSPPVEFTRGLTTSKFKCPRRLSLAQCRSERRKPPREVLGPHSTLPPQWDDPSIFSKSGDMTRSSGFDRS